MTIFMLQAVSKWDILNLTWRLPMPVWLHVAVIETVEILFLSAALYCVHRAQKSRIYPALWQLLIFLVVSDSILAIDAISHGLGLISRVHGSYIYFYTYWASYAIQAILIIRVLHEMFRHALRSMPGMQKLGRPVFFWAVAVSVILATASGMTSHGNGMDILLASAQVLIRSQSVLALCLLTFLAFASHTLGVSFRSRIFGVTFGFAAMALNDLVISALAEHMTSLVGTINLVHEIVYLAAVALWAGYFLQPEPARRLVTMPATSPLMRWNDVAQTLGNPAGQIAVSYPPSFMTDVFDLVNNVMEPAGWPREAIANSPPGPVAS
jgi:uncharacterized membrane protein required for colicin V production